MAIGSNQTVKSIPYPLGDIVPCHSHRVIEVDINNFMLRIGAQFESNTSAEYTTTAAARDRAAL
jgi:hypothetical protein